MVGLLPYLLTTAALIAGYCFLGQPKGRECARIVTGMRDVHVLVELILI